MNDKPRKKRRKKHFFRDALIVVAFITGLYFLASSNLFAIKRIDVQGNNYSTKMQLVETSGISNGDNLFKTSLSQARHRLESDPYIIEAKLSRKLPDGVLISIREREEDFAVKTAEGVAIVDYEGMVLRLSDDAGSLTLVENLSVDRAEPGKALEVEEAALLTQLIQLMRVVEAGDLFFKRISASDVSIKAYIYDNLVCRGSLKNIKDNVESLKAVLVDLQDKEATRGTIYISGTGVCTFTPQEESG
jgi:cell division protein FtsQ